MNGRFPYATLHLWKTKGARKAIDYQVKLSGLSPDEAKKYLQKCIVTEGQPHLYDLYVGGDVGTEA